MFVLRIFEPLSSVNLLKGVYKVHKQSVLSFSCGELVHEEKRHFNVCVDIRPNEHKKINQHCPFKAHLSNAIITKTNSSETR